MIDLCGKSLFVCLWMISTIVYLHFKGDCSSHSFAQEEYVVTPLHAMISKEKIASSITGEIGCLDGPKCQ